MQFRKKLLRVIFMLSTIVGVTDCCSSRILLLREHTLNIVNQPKFIQSNDHNANHAHQLHHQQQQQIQQQQAAQDKVPQHVDIVASELDFNKNFSGFASRSSNEDDSKTSLSPNVEMLSSSQPLEEKPPDQTSDELTTAISIEALVNSSDFITDATVREQQSGNPKYHVIDFYYTIMRDVLSFQCQGIFLTNFCLNGGRCFRYPVGNDSFLSCECADGYVGERCESKSLNGLYIPPDPTLLDVQQPKIRMARIVFSFPMLIAISVIYIIFGAIIVFRCPKKYRREAAGSLLAD